jgi:hypothetical protein
MMTRVSYEMRGDGSAVMRPAPGLDELFGSLKLKRPVASSREEKQAAREAISQHRKPKRLPGIDRSSGAASRVV